MRENFVQSMEKQVEAQTHEESKVWRASQPLPNQSSMQGRELEKKSNIQQFRMTMQNFRIACEMPKKSTSYRTESKTVKNEFRTLCEISQALQKSSCVIFRYFCTYSVRFLSRDILCNYLFYPCNQLKIFLDIQDI